MSYPIHYVVAGLNMRDKMWTLAVNTGELGFEDFKIYIDLNFGSFGTT